MAEWHITNDMVNDFALQLIDEERSDSTINKYRHDLKVFMAYTWRRWHKNQNYEIKKFYVLIWMHKLFLIASCLYKC